MAEYSAPKNDTPIFNPIEFIPKINVSAVATDVTGIQEEIDALDSQIVVQETALSTIGLPNTTINLTTPVTTTSAGTWTAYSTSLTTGVYLVKFFVYATCPQNNGEGIKQIQSFYTSSATGGTRNQNCGLYLYAKHGLQQVCSVAFQQQFLIVATATTTYNFQATGITYNATNITYNNAAFGTLGKGATISIMRIK